MDSLSCLSKALNSFLSAIASLVYSPCFRWACLILSIPSGVLGPVLFPPCSLHLPFFMAGARQGVPFRVLAPHREAFIKSPGRLAFLSQPLRFSRGFSLILPSHPSSPLDLLSICPTTDLIFPFIDSIRVHVKERAKTFYSQKLIHIIYTLNSSIYNLVFQICLINLNFSHRYQDIFFPTLLRPYQCLPLTLEEISQGY